MSEHRSDRENKVSLYERGGELVSDEPLYATADGKIVGEGDPAAQELVAAAGLPIRKKTAERYGLKASGKGKGEAPKEKEEKPGPEEDESEKKASKK